MARNAKTTDTWADNSMWLNCPMCAWEGEVYYSRKSPKYCSDACKQKAYRLNRKKNKAINDPRLSVLLQDIKDRGFGRNIGHIEKFAAKFGYEATLDMAFILDMVAMELRSGNRGQF